MCRSARLLVLALSLCGLCVATAPAVADDHDRSAAVERLAALGKVWGQARYLHPYLSTRRIDWDAPLVATIPKVRAATSDAEYVAAVDAMLQTLGDPVTRVAPLPATAATGAARPLIRREGAVVVIDLTSLEGRPEAEVQASLGAVPAALADATAVVFDLRFAGDAPDWATWLLDRWAPLLLPDDAAGPAMRAIVHDGYAPQGKLMSSGGYSTYAKTVAGVRYRRAPATRPASADVRVVYLTNPRMLLDGAPWAAQRSGHGFVVAQGAARYALGDWTDVPLPGGRSASIRTTEWSEAAFGADVTVPANRDGLKAALALARKKGAIKPRVAQPAPLPMPRFVADATYDDQLAPSVELRLLALFRVWTVIDRFYPYLPLIGDWDAVLPASIPRFEAATTAEAYAAALLELGTHVPDGHTFISGHPGFAALRGGPAFLAVELRWIDKQAVVTLIDAPAAIAAGLQVGDVVTAVDGEPMTARLPRLLAYVSASTEATRYRNALGYALRGPAGDALLTVTRAKGVTKELRIPRADAWTPPTPPTGLPYRLIGADLGYVVLEDLTPAQVAPMFEAFKATKGIVFDMRGYPQGTAWAIAPRLNTRKAPYAAMFHRRFVDPAMGGRDATTLEFLQTIPPTTDWLYQGKTVMLIDDRTQSQAEHTGLFFEAANGTKFIGTPSAGANGDVTAMVLPGGVSWMFTGHDVRHADGRQLQRLGLQPDVRIAPTLAGIRAGKDEVLDRAVAYLRTGN
jgi:C-terminal processing protease CtpA/Prc